MPLTPRGPRLRGKLCCLAPSSLIRPHAPVPQARHDFAFTLIRNAFAVRERLGDPRDLPYFHCCTFHACHRPYPGGSADSFPVKQPAVPDFLDLGASRHPPHPVSASNLRREFDFGAASFALCYGQHVCLALLTGYDRMKSAALHLAF